VKPQPLAPRQRPQLSQIVDRPGVGRACAADHEERAPPGLAILVNACDERVDADSIGGIARHDAQRIVGEAGHHQRLGYRVMNLIRGVDGGEAHIAVEHRFARRHDCAQIGERAAREQHTASAFAETHELRQPANDRVL
jgi:hypothetical protein